MDGGKDRVDALIGDFADPIAGIVDEVGVVACTAEEGSVGALAADNRVVARAAVDGESDRAEGKTGDVDRVVAGPAIDQQAGRRFRH